MQPSGVAARRNLWEVRRDPYDVSRIFVRGPDGWITCYWRHLDRMPVPFGELAWDHARRQLAADGRAATEQQIADTVAGLLARAYRARNGKRRRCPGGTGGGCPDQGGHAAARRQSRSAGRRHGANPFPAGAARRRRTTGGGDPAGRLRPVQGSRQALVNAMISDQHRQLTTLAGWRRFAGEVPAVPELLAQEVWAGLQDDKRLAYDEDRLDHHSRLLVIETAVIRKVITEGRRLSYLNRHAISGRCGLIMSGPAGTGKTTAVTQLGKMTEVMHRKRHPGSGGDIPVVYITAPPAATAKMIAVEFARFLGLPVARRLNITDITEAVCGVCLDARTSLVCVENPQPGHGHPQRRRGLRHPQVLLRTHPGHLRLRRDQHRAAGLLSGTRGEQIAGRFAMIRTGPFPRDAQWTSLIAALEHSLRLHRHVPGALPGLDLYLHQRTGGSIGTLLRLIRSAAIQAILDGSERITTKTLESIEVDIAAETARRKTRSR